MHLKAEYRSPATEVCRNLSKAMELDYPVIAVILSERMHQWETQGCFMQWGSNLQAGYIDAALQPLHPGWVTARALYAETCTLT